MHRFIGRERGHRDSRRTRDWRRRTGGRSPASWISVALNSFLDLLNRLANHTARLAGLELALNLDKRSVGGVETSRKDRGDVEGDGWIASKQRRRVGDLELRLLQSPHVCRMGLI